MPISPPKNEEPAATDHGGLEIVWTTKPSTQGQQINDHTYIYAHATRRN